MITIELNLYPEKFHSNNSYKYIEKFYTEKDIKDLHQSAIDNNLKINTILQNRQTETYILIIAYVDNPTLIYTMSNEASFIRCQYISENGELGPIIKYSFTISELLKYYSIIK